MEETPSRISIAEDQGKTVINIKPHNSILHAFFVLLIESGIFILMVFIFAMLAGAFKTGFIITVLAYTLAAIYRIYFGLFIFIVLRSLLWTIAGGEKIEIDDKIIKYSKQIAGISRTVTIQKEEILEISVIDYLREKDVIHMMQSEMTTHGRSILLKTAKKSFKLGIYISMDDADTLEKELKSHLSL